MGTNCMVWKPRRQELNKRTQSLAGDARSQTDKVKLGSHTLNPGRTATICAHTHTHKDTQAPPRTHVYTHPHRLKMNSHSENSLQELSAAANTRASDVRTVRETLNT